MSDAFFKVTTNSKLYVYNSLFEENFSLSRGSVFLADYEESYIYVANSNFTRNFAL